MATIYEVSELAGVSLATVSRVMNGSANVSVRTEEKVQKAMKKLGYTPNSAAISLASKRSNCIGILVAELDGVFFGGMMQGIESELRIHRKHAVITAGHADREHEKKGIEFLKSRNCDALILHAESLSDEYLIELSKDKTPVYLLNRLIPEISSRCISLDDYHGGLLAAQYILDHGHTQVVCISGPKNKNDAMARVNGLKTAFLNKGLPFNQELVYEGDFLQQSGVKAIDHFLAQNISFTAIVCGNDQMAIGAMARLRENNITPAVDVAIIGFDDVTFASCTFPKLTTVQYPIEEMGKTAACLALKEIYNIQSDAVARVFDPVLIERDSVQMVNKSET